MIFFYNSTVLQKNKRRHFAAVLLILPVLLLCAGGCALFDRQEEKSLRLERAEQKKRNYDALYQAIVSNSLRKGLTTREVQRLYGEPDDVFSSGTTSSRLEVWTYTKVKEPGEKETWQNIRLYFDNGKLISWQY